MKKLFAFVTALFAVALATPVVAQNIYVGDVSVERGTVAKVPVRNVGTAVKPVTVTFYTGLPSDTGISNVDYSGLAKQFDIAAGQTLTVDVPTHGVTQPQVSVSTRVLVNRNGSLKDGSGILTIKPKAAPPPPPPTQTCWDGSVILATASCPTRPTQTCWDGSVIFADQLCPVRPTQTCWDGSVIFADLVCPTPPPPPPPSDPLKGVTPITSITDVGPMLKAKVIPPSAKPDVVGAFRFICNAGQLLRDDPIVYPGQPGKSHLHQFYGNTGANASSTYKSLRESGDSTCGKPLNRSAYWMPAMLDGNGNVVRPDFVSIYYKRRPKTDPVCGGLPGTFTALGKVVQGKCINLPNGIKFIFGYDMLTGKAPTGFLWFNCGGVKFKNLEAPECNVPGRQIGAVIEAPDCWDGKNLDSANHRDHVAYGFYGDYGFVCPSTHPYVIPTFTLGAWFTVPPNAKMGLSSDEMMPSLPRGTTFHADFWMAWEPAIHDRWEGNCLEQLLNCDSGDLGDGWQIIDAWIRSDPSPKLVPLSSLGL